MSYVINNSRGNIVAVVPDGTINTTATSVNLVGRGVTPYGLPENENYVYLLENFASSTAPLAPILGQLWYNSSNDVISSYNTANAWSALASETYVQAQKASPAFTGVPTAPTADYGTNTTQVATTAFVQGEKLSPAFTGTPTAPTAGAGTNNTQIATTAYTDGAVSNFNDIVTATYAPLNSPALFGTPTSTTFAAGTNGTQIATTAFVQGEKVSPAFTGIPTAPTAGAGTNSTQIATTAFVYSVTGTMAAQSASAIAITGGTISGLSSPIPVASGGTGGNTAASARSGIGAASASLTITAGAGLTGGGDLTNDRTLAIASTSNGYGNRTVSTAAPAGGSNGDIWYQI